MTLDQDTLDMETTPTRRKSGNVLMTAIIIVLAMVAVGTWGRLCFRRRGRHHDRWRENPLG